MEDILNKLDEIIRHIDFRSHPLDSEVYDGITFGQIIELALFIKKNIHTNKEYYVDCFDYGSYNNERIIDKLNTVSTCL